MVGEDDGWRIALQRLREKAEHGGCADGLVRVAPIEADELNAFMRGDPAPGAASYDLF